MKYKFFVINRFTTRIITVLMFVIILIVIIVFKYYREKTDLPIMEAESAVKENSIITNQFESNTRNLIAYENMEKEIEGCAVIGKIEIPKINLNTYILSETNDKSLNISVTKFYGPEINQVGNFCIVGHHYNKPTMFGKLRELEIGDTIKIIDIYGQYVVYSVYDIYKVNPDEIECLNQDTKGEREITLITCTTTALKRLIVKAIEIYD